MVKLLFWGGIIAVAYFYFNKPNVLNQGKNKDISDKEEYTDYEEID